VQTAHVLGARVFATPSASEKDLVSWTPYLKGMGRIRRCHLRYFIAVAEEGSLTLAAERGLRTAQPSLSRQIRDLEYEVGAQLLRCSALGIEVR
jgi:LysR family transcriptional regulator, hca operon transcriptional activator